MGASPVTVSNNNYQWDGMVWYGTISPRASSNADIYQK